MPSPNILDIVTLRANAVIRLDDGRLLFANGRYDGAAYIDGYAVEFALKARVCETLNLGAYPDHIAGFKTHKLDILLLLTGQVAHVKQNALAEWSFVVERWTPEMRYAPSGAIKPGDVQTLLDAANVLLNLL